MSKLLQHRSIDTVPSSLVAHLQRIKTFVQIMNPGLKADYLANMLNNALAKRTRKVGIKAYAKALADDSLPEKLVPDLQPLMPRRFADLLKFEGGQAGLTVHALMLLLEDGLHPLATLSGWNIGSCAQEQLESTNDKTLIAEQVRLLFPHRSDVISPFYRPAMLVMEQKSFWATISPQRAARQLHRFALHLSQDGDLLSQLHAEFFAPALRADQKDFGTLKFARKRPMENGLQSSIGRVIDLHPELDGGRIQGLNWNGAILRNWVFNGHISELPPGVHPADYTDDFQRYFNIVPALSLHYLPIHEHGHPLAELIEQAFLKFHQTEQTRQDSRDDMIRTHPFEIAFRPDLAQQIGLSYEALHQRLFSDYWQHCQMDFIDHALQEFSDTWGRPLPSQDPALLVLNSIGRHPEWLNNNRGHLAHLLEPLLLSKKTIPNGLMTGTLPLNIVPESMTEIFVRSLLTGSVSMDGLKRIDDLVKSKRLDPDLVADQIERLFLSKKTMPQSLLTGATSLSIIPDRLLGHFLKVITTETLSADGCARIDELIESGRIDPHGVLELVTDRESLLLLSKSKSLKPLVLNRHSETLADEILSRDLGL